MDLDESQRSRDDRKPVFSPSVHLEPHSLGVMKVPEPKVFIISFLVEPTPEIEFRPFNIAKCMLLRNANLRPAKSKVSSVEGNVAEFDLSDVRPVSTVPF